MYDRSGFPSLLREKMITILLIFLVTGIVGAVLRLHSPMVFSLVGTAGIAATDPFLMPLSFLSIIGLVAILWWLDKTK